MPSINTLVPDIYDLVKSKGGWENVCFEKISTGLQKALVKPDSPSRLRLSQLGDKCPCALWNSIHHPELAEPLPPYAVIKYTYGHIIEALIIELARAAGHEVTGEQDELVVDGVVGHRDCVIDGAIVDVKSASSFGFKKFKDGTIRQDDPFGYLDQLDAYVVGSAEDDLVRVKDRGYNLVVDKTLGHLYLYEHVVRPWRIRERIRLHREIIQQPSQPDCSCGTVPDGKSGNIRLDTKASYSNYKHVCFPSLRTFLYADGPRYLTRVNRLPDVPEITPLKQLQTVGNPTENSGIRESSETVLH